MTCIRSRFFRRVRCVATSRDERSFVNFGKVEALAMQALRNDLSVSEFEKIASELEKYIPDCKRRVKMYNKMYAHAMNIFEED